MITEKRAALLEALGLYGYLTPQQMLFSLGLFSDENSLRSALDAMKRQGLVSSCKPWPKPGEGRFPSVFSLTAAGAALIEAPPELRGRPLKPDPPADIEHRVAIVQSHIALRAWATRAGHQVTGFVPDFARSPERDRKATGIKTPLGIYTPDALMGLVGNDGTFRPLVIEVYRGGITGRATYLRRKLPEAVQQIGTREVQAAHAPPDQRRSAARLLVIVDSDPLLTSLKRSLPDPDLPGWDLTFIKTLDQVAVDPYRRWWRPRHGVQDLF